MPNLLGCEKGLEDLRQELGAAERQPDDDAGADAYEETPEGVPQRCQGGAPEIVAGAVDAVPEASFPEQPLAAADAVMPDLKIIDQCIGWQ